MSDLLRTHDGACCESRAEMMSLQPDRCKECGMQEFVIKYQTPDAICFQCCFCGVPEEVEIEEIDDETITSFGR